MPIFDFKCITCDTVFEFLKIRSDETIECPNCKEKESKKLLKQVSTGTGFQLKGKWFKQGY